MVKLVTFGEDLRQRLIARTAMVRMESDQKILTGVDEPGMCGQPWRLVLPQKAENVLILKKEISVWLGWDFLL